MTSQSRNRLVGKPERNSSLFLLALATDLPIDFEQKLAGPEAIDLPAAFLQRGSIGRPYLGGFSLSDANRNLKAFGFAR